MSAPVAASEMILAARRLTGTESLDQANAFVSDAEALAILNGLLAELYDEILAQGFGDYYRSTQPITAQAGVGVYPFLVDVYEISSVDVNWAPDVVTSARLFRESDRNRYRRVMPTWSQFCPVWFRPLGGNIEFIPTPQAALSIQVNYIPAFTPLVALTDTFDSQNQWHWFAIWGLAAAIRGKDDDEAGAGLALSEKEKVRERIRTMAGRRVEGEPPRVERRPRLSDEDF